MVSIPDTCCIIFCRPVFSPAEVGAEGQGYIWKASSLDDTEDEELAQCLWGTTASLKFVKVAFPMMLQSKFQQLFICVIFTRFGVEP